MPALITPLIPISVASIYNNSALPARMAKCTPDTAVAIQAVVDDLKTLGHQLRLSDLFRSYQMQRDANVDYVEGRKKAYSPPPGGSMHEAGRAMDIDLSSMGVPLAQFWEVAKGRGFFPIIDKPIPERSESWHFDHRGSHDAVYAYVQQGHAGASIAPYKQMAHSAILAIGVNVDEVPDQRVAWLQAGLIRIGFDPGRIDGVMGQRSLAAIREAALDADDPASSLATKLKERYPEEF